MLSSTVAVALALLAVAGSFRLLKKQASAFIMLQDRHSKTSCSFWQEAHAQQHCRSRTGAAGTGGILLAARGQRTSGQCSSQHMSSGAAAACVMPSVPESRVRSFASLRLATLLLKLVSPADALQILTRLLTQVRLLRRYGGWLAAGRVHPGVGHRAVHS